MERVLSKNFSDVYEYMDSMGVTWRTANDFDRYYRGWLKTKPWYVPRASCAYYWWADEFHRSRADIKPGKLYEIWTLASQLRAKCINDFMLGKEQRVLSVDESIGLILCWFKSEWIDER